MYSRRLYSTLQSECSERTASMGCAGLFHSVLTPSSLECLFKVDALFFDDQRAILHHGMNGTYVLADDSERNELDGTKEKQPHYDWCNTDLKVIPENQFGHQISSAR